MPRMTIAAWIVMATLAVSAAETQERSVSRVSGDRLPELPSLRRARDLAERGELGRAAEIYVSVAESPAAPREAVVEAAAGLYRVSAWREAVAAFRRLTPFARGEEDLRYYFAVSLYESGAYRDAQNELSCALPYLEITDDVVRYRWKIEQTVAVMARSDPDLRLP